MSARALRLYHLIRRTVQVCSRLFSLVAAGCVLAMMFVMGGEVISRASGNGSLPWAYGLIQLLLVMAVFLAAPLSEQVNEQIRVNLFTQRMRPRVAAVARILGNVLTFVIIIWLTAATWERAIHSTSIGEYQDGLVPFPMWPARIIVTVGLVFLLLELLFRVVDQTRTVIMGGLPETEFVVEGEVIETNTEEEGPK